MTQVLRGVINTLRSPQPALLALGFIASLLHVHAAMEALRAGHDREEVEEHLSS